MEFLQLLLGQLGHSSILILGHRLSVGNLFFEAGFFVDQGKDGLQLTLTLGQPRIIFVTINSRILEFLIQILQLGSQLLFFLLHMICLQYKEKPPEYI